MEVRGDKWGYEKRENGKVLKEILQRKITIPPLSSHPHANGR